MYRVCACVTSQHCLSRTIVVRITQSLSAITISCHLVYMMYYYLYNIINAFQELSVILYFIEETIYVLFLRIFPFYVLNKENRLTIFTGVRTPANSRNWHRNRNLSYRRNTQCVSRHYETESLIN